MNLSKIVKDANLNVNTFSSLFNMHLSKCTGLREILPTWQQNKFATGKGNSINYFVLFCIHNFSAPMQRQLFENNIIYLADLANQSCITLFDYILTVPISKELHSLSVLEIICLIKL